MGREQRRLSADEKPLGRNELIAQYLYNRLGPELFMQLTVKPDGTSKLPRKVVSSHVQVLKQKFGRKVHPPIGRPYSVAYPEVQLGKLLFFAIRTAP